MTPEEARQLADRAANAWRRDSDQPDAMPESITQEQAKEAAAATQAAWDRAGAPAKNADLDARVAEIIARDPFRRATDPDVIAEAKRPRDDKRGDSLATRSDAHEERQAPRRATFADARDDELITTESGIVGRWVRDPQRGRVFVEDRTDRADTRSTRVERQS